MDPRSAVTTAIAAGGLLGAIAAGLNLPTTGLAAPLISEIAAEVIAPVQWDLPVVRNESVQRFVDLFEQKQPDRMALYLKRSGRYEGMIRTKLRERGMPEDLLYLSMIESGFNPNARSKAQAVGLWQFIAGTGRLYGLRIDSYVDERRDPEKSTDAALQYLQDLYNQFGSWNLAAAAYNTGGNRVARIMREETGAVRGQESDFWRIRSRLPGETREYVPLIFAAALIGKEPEKYGLERVERLLPVPVERVDVPGGVPLEVVAKAVNAPTEALRELNPHLLQGRTPPGEGYPVVIPEGRTAVFAANFEKARAEYQPPAPVRAQPARAQPARTQPARTAARTHRVARGENLSTIARRHNTSVTALQRANNMGRNTLIRPGQVLRIPA
jgi:membrane-bound lytic murein transglycosylase D